MCVRNISHTFKLVPNRFVPTHEHVLKNDVTLLQDFIQSYAKLFVITGAGISTESGIPDYRSKGVGLYSQNSYQPMRIKEFLSSSQAQRRYWARSYIQWPIFSSSQPNQSHYILNDWFSKGKIHTLLTQNVDELHKKAGTLEAIELHGSVHKVHCLNCQKQMSREAFQIILDSVNIEFSPEVRDVKLRPDADIYLEEDEVSRFILPKCPSCDIGIMQPNIVFFGANVKKEKVEQIYEKINYCDSILVLGSSLQVFSALRFVLRGKERNLPIGIVSLGTTRGDNLAKFKIVARLGEILPIIKI